MAPCPRKVLGRPDVIFEVRPICKWVYTKGRWRLGTKTWFWPGPLFCPWASFDWPVAGVGGRGFVILEKNQQGQKIKESPLFTWASPGWVVAWPQPVSHTHKNMWKTGITPLQVGHRPTPPFFLGSSIPIIFTLKEWILSHYKVSWPLLSEESSPFFEGSCPARIEIIYFLANGFIISSQACVSPRRQ